MSEYLESAKKYKGYHYSVLTPEMMQYLHDRTLEMLRIIIPIFEANNIRYMICGGTLLGAATTNHFIPWDDDVDICILDEDYNKMKECLDVSLPGWMALQQRATENNYYHGWVKIRDTKSKVHPSEGLYQYNGVWIDLYKLTRIRGVCINYRVAKEHFDYLTRRYRGGISFLELIDRSISNRLFTRIIKEGIKAVLNSDKSYRYVIWSASKIVLDEDWLFPRKRYTFEGLELYSFACADKYLARHYGESFRELPPDELRRVGINRIEIF